jgi:hypothetical protein
MRQTARCLLIGLIALTLFHPTFAGSFDESPKLTEQVAAWIDALDSEDRQARYEAEQGLIEAGPDVLPLLPPAEMLPGVTAREAVRRVRIKLEREKALASVRASRVTLDGTMPLSEIVAAVTEQTGNPIDVSSLPADALAEPVPVSVRDLPFWDVIAEFEETKLGVAFHPEHGLSLVLDANAPEPLAVQNVGAFRVAAVSLKPRPLVGQDDRQLVRARVHLAPEPRLRPLFLALAAADVSLTAADGTKLPPFNPAAKYELPVGLAGAGVQFDLDFVAPQPLPKGPFTLNGRVTMTVAADTEEVRFTKLPEAAGTARRRGGVTVRLEDVSFSRGDDGRHSARLKVLVAYDTGGPAFESHRTWIFHNQVALQARDGRRFRRDGVYSTALQGDGGVIVEYGFSDLPIDPAKLSFVYEAPTLITDVPIAWTLSKLPVAE